MDNNEILEVIHRETKYLLKYHDNLLSNADFNLHNCNPDKISFRNKLFVIEFCYSISKLSRNLQLDFDYLNIIKLDEKPIKLGDLLKKVNSKIDLKKEVKKNLDDYVSKNETYQQLIDENLIDYFKTGNL